MKSIGIEERKLSLIGLSKIAKIGPATTKRLITTFGSPEEVFRAPRRHLLRVPGIGEHLASEVRKSRTLRVAEKELRYAESHGIEVLSYFDSQYPNSIRNTSYAPLILYKKGKADLNARPMISIVGTRKPSIYGQRLACEFAHFFSIHGFNVVSGLAFGIDIKAHEAAMETSGLTTGVLGHGLDRIYPSQHASKAERMLDNGGVLLSEFTSGTTPEPYNFPARNRIISGLAFATIVIEARERGGAQITARFAFDQNREVYAVPGPIGSPTSVGCNQLIRDHVAKLVLAPEEILEDLRPMIADWGIEEVQGQGRIRDYGELSQEEDKIVSFLHQEGAAEEGEIRKNLGFEIRRLGAILLKMELKGVLGQVSGKQYALQ